MRIMRPWALLLGLFLLNPGGGATAQAPKRAAHRQGETPMVRAEKEVEYDNVEGESLKLDLYRPLTDGAKPHPGIIFVHGGGWSGGDKGEYTGKAQEMAQRGYVAITVNYRLAPKFRYPAAVEDVQAAVRWLRNHAHEYDLDVNRIGALGSSAGGHLVSMLGVLDDSPSYTHTNLHPEGPSARVNCVVDYFGRMDLTLEPTQRKFTDYRPAFIGKPKSDAFSLYQEASPIQHVDGHTVPFLIIHGSEDTQVEPVQSFHMLAALQKEKVESSLLLLANAGHGFGGAPGDMGWDAAKAFLDRHLHPK